MILRFKCALVIYYDKYSNVYCFAKKKSCKHFSEGYLCSDNAPKSPKNKAQNVPKTFIIFSVLSFLKYVKLLAKSYDAVFDGEFHHRTYV